MSKKAKPRDGVDVRFILDLLEKREINLDTKLATAYDEVPEAHHHRCATFVQWNFNSDQNALELRPVIGLTIDYKDACRQLANVVIKLEQDNETLKKIAVSSKPRASRKSNPRSAK